MSSNYLVVNQWPPEGGARSPLAEVDRNSVSGDSAVSVTESADLGYLVLRARSEQQSAIEAELGCSLPVVPLTSVTSGETCVRWISPTEWLITVPAGETAVLEATLRNNLGEEIAVVDNSGGYACLRIEGEMASMVIRKSTGYDVHPSNFPEGKVVTTTFAAAQAVLRGLGDDQYELVFRRSFADYIWRWLRDAADEYGMNIQ